MLKPAYSLPSPVLTSADLLPPLGNKVSLLASNPFTSYANLSSISCDSCNPISWVIDIGATYHMVCFIYFLAFIISPVKASQVV